jgi:hypothetical protein
MKHFPLGIALLTSKEGQLLVGSLGGRHAPENQTGAPNGQLSRVFNPP